MSNRPFLSPRRCTACAALLGMAALAALATAPGAAVAAPAAVSPRAAAPAHRVTYAATRSPADGATFTETWSTGPIRLGYAIAQSSPVEVTLDGQPSVVVGDRAGFLDAFELSDAVAGGSGPPTPTIPAGWADVHANAPIDSTPSVATTASGTDILVGSGNDAFPDGGGYQAYDTDGSLRWITPVVDPTSDGDPAGGVFAGLSVGTLQAAATTGPSAVAGSLGQVAYSLDPSSGDPLPGWPFLDTDSTHATSALADLYGTGRDEIVQASDQTAGLAAGQQYHDGGTLRILSGTGDQICRASTDQVLDSSPAVGGFLPGGATGIVDGTGDFFAGASDTDTVRAFDTHCRPVWSATLDGDTFSSPALSDVLGNGSLQVVEGTSRGVGGGGSVYALDGATGATIWSAAVPEEVIGSVTTADLFHDGYDDVLVPTIDGLDILDGRTGDLVAALDGPGQGDLGLQNSPLVTVDPDGDVGITLAGYVPGAARVDHFEIADSDGAAAVGAGSWPMFHHDAQLTGDAGGTPAPGSVPVCSVPSAAYDGYELATSDGGVRSYPDPGQPFCGSAGGEHLVRPVVGIATAPSIGGYWLAASDGGVFAYGQAGFLGSMGGSHLDAPIVGIAATPDGGGYWLVAADGGIFAYGDAAFLGSMGGSHLDAPIVGMAATADGGGYWLVAADGGIFAYGDAAFDGSLGGLRLHRPIVGIARDPHSGGYWILGADGGIFAFGGAPYLGSTGGQASASSMVGMAASTDGSGYRLAGANGGLFAYDAPFLGAATLSGLVAPVTGIAGS